MNDIPPGNGAVLRLNGRRCAVYRDEQGHASVFSARCSHLGCLMQFNDAERIWECPCHGSRLRRTARSCTGLPSGLWDLASCPKPGMSRGSSADAEW
ncbi:Rieske 2Fe-2S domain-containing protein [Streptomyces sp. V1I1]|uniref:Rieske 2Fe-2S domain-containing protein n=1 Tax=Streptomyces sp. V1I1 TaxID=3042272 RepID=UPI0027D866FD|nr:Rieske 2Fe-2S domain-containing protein [Streptomyces sp. V1I1]